MLCSAVLANTIVHAVQLLALATLHRCKMAEEGPTTCYQIVSEDVISPLDDSPIEHTVEHNGQTLVYEEQPTHTHSYTPSSTHSSSSSTGEVQRGWTYEDQFKEVSQTK